jgi:hypothetical protein
MIASYGPVEAVADVSPLGAWSANITINFRDGAASAYIVVDPAAPNQVTGLRVTGFTGREATIDAVAAKIAALPGSTGFALAKLGAGKPQLLQSHAPDSALAVGSAFKLAILAELVRATNAGERKWDDMVTIDGSPLPGGTYTLIPKGIQFPLREIAGKMISISDNSATDILLKLVGRDRVEAMLPVLGVAGPARNRPYMSTLEMFKLKGVAGLADRYLALDAKGRRAMLDGEVAAIPNSAVDAGLFKDGKPVRIDTLEWYFSPADMVRIMDWLRRHTESGPGAEARAILGINPGLAPGVKARWKSVGYKGGSEPGVLNLTFLLEGKDGSWFVLTGTWNNIAPDVEQAKFGGLISRAAELAAPK